MTETASRYRFRGQSSSPALSLCNTCDDRPGVQLGHYEPEGDHLERAQDALEWLRLCDIGACRGFRVPERKAAEELLKALLALRECLYRVFLGVLRDEPDRAALGELNKIIAHLPAAVLEESSGALQYRRLYRDFSEAAIGSILEDAISLLTTPRLQQLKVCSAQGCGWLFLDTSKNSSRRWCEMGDCGNREKARRFYAKTHPPR